MNRKELENLNRLYAKIVSIEDLIESLKINEEDKDIALGRLDRSDWGCFIPE